TRAATGDGLYRTPSFPLSAWERVRCHAASSRSCLMVESERQTPDGGAVVPVAPDRGVTNGREAGHPPARRRSDPTDGPSRDVPTPTRLPARAAARVLDGRDVQLAVGLDAERLDVPRLEDSLAVRGEIEQLVVGVQDVQVAAVRGELGL